MDIIKTIIVGGVAALAVAIGFNVIADKEVPALGALSSPNIPSYIDVQGFLQFGNGKTTVTPSSATYTLTSADMVESSIITFTASSTMPALTVSLPASSTFPLSTRVGAERSWRIENPFLAAATTTTIAAGTGIDLQEPDGQNVVIGITNYAWITCVRGLDSGAPEDIVCSVDETVPAD